MKAGWQTKTIGEICVLVNGRAYKKDELLDVGKYPVLRVGNFFTNDHWYHSDLELDTDKYCDNGDLLYAWSASFGPRIWEGGKVIYHYHIWKVLPNPTLVEQKFLFRLLEWDVDQIKLAHGTGTTMMHVSKGSMESRIVPLPPLPEQQRIVAILDEAFEGIATATDTAKKNLNNARELFDSTLQSVFTAEGNEWAKHTLKEMSLAFGRGKSKHRPRNDPKLYGGQYPFIQTGDIRNANHLITKYTQTYNEQGLAQSKLWVKGTLCITIAANIAETGILDFDSCFPDSVIGFVADPSISDVHFVEYLLSSFKTMLQAKGKGSAQDNINLATFENERFPFPSLQEQKVVVANLDELSAETKKLEAIYQQKLTALEELKKSILNQAFSGQLSIKDKAAA